MSEGGLKETGFSRFSGSHGSMATEVMMKNLFHPMSVFMLVVAPSLACAQTERKVSAAEVPEAVKRAIAQRLPGAKITGYSLETADGVRLYEAECVAAGRRHDLTVTAEGVVREDEETIPIGEIPAAVRTSFEKEFPKARIVRAEKITAGDKVTYELSLQNSPRKEAVFSPDGKLISAK
ncbi:MAG: PepSY-like domain-containing protein [Bryobacteraceae bacterium]